MASREEKIRTKQERSLRRIKKRIEKDKSNMRFYGVFDKGISFARRRLQGRVMVCEMRYSSCEARGYCNGDC